MAFWITCVMGNRKHQKGSLNILHSLSVHEESCPYSVRMQLFSAARLCPTDLSLCVSRMGHVFHFKLSGLSIFLHHIAQHLQIPAMRIGHLIHQPLGLISNTLRNSSLSFSGSFYTVFLCSLL